VVAEVGAASAGGSSTGGGNQPDGGAGGAPSGAGGAAGAGGAEPKVGYLSLPQAATLCARVFACDQVGESIRASTGVPIDRASSFSHCMTWLAGPLPSDRQPSPGQVEMLEHMVEAPDCDATRKAAWVEKLDVAAAICDGHTDRRCSPSGMEVIDCSSRKHVEHCGNALLGAETSCSQSGPSTACSDDPCGGLQGFCEGNGITYCLGYLWEIAGCRERGLVCNKAALECRDEAGADQNCTTAGDTLCDGEVAKVCAEGIGTTGKKVKSPFDCAKVGAGATCQLEPAIHCEPPAPACSLMDPDACSGGNHIQLCVAGELRDFDCGGIQMECIADASARCGTPTVP
jgi:hypothetical protein